MHEALWELLDSQPNPSYSAAFRGQMAVIIHFERDISHLAQAGTTFPLVEGWS